MNEKLGLIEQQQHLRESAMRNMTAAGRHQAFPALFAKPVPFSSELDTLKAKVEALTKENALLKGEVARLKDEKRQIADKLASARLQKHAPEVDGVLTRNATIANVQAVFIEVYNETKGNDGGEPYTISDLLSPDRARDSSWPRQVCMSLAKTICDRSLPTIGRAFGKRDHTTVLHAVKAAEDHMAEVPVLAATHARVIEHFRVL